MTTNTIVKEDFNGLHQLDIPALLAAQGKLFLTGTIDSGSAGELIRSMMYLAGQEQRITLYLDSTGGEVQAGLAIVDAIELLCKRTDVDIVCFGRAYSMAAVILAAGKKGRRFMLPHAAVMIHEPLIAQGTGGSVSTVRSVAETLMETRDMLSGILSRSTGRPVGEINDDILRSRFFSAEQAVEYGLADEITDRL